MDTLPLLIVSSETKSMSLSKMVAVKTQGLEK
nr:MAG TPA: hypothetical protein [Caudoviricetes sp.]